MAEVNLEENVISVSALFGRGSCHVQLPQTSSLLRPACLALYFLQAGRHIGKVR